MRPHFTTKQIDGTNNNAESMWRNTGITEPLGTTINKWSKNFYERPHRGGFFCGKI